MDRKQVDFGREKEVFPLVLIQVKSAAKRTVFDLKNKREKTFLPFKTQLFHIQVVRYAASGGNIWMTEAEIVELFGTTAGAVHTGIKAIFKENTLNDYEVCKCIRLDSGNSADVYNMEVVVALASRLNTYPASVFRKWLVNTPHPDARHLRLSFDIRTGF